MTLVLKTINFLSWIVNVFQIIHSIILTICNIQFFRGGRRGRNHMIVVQLMDITIKVVSSLRGVLDITLCVKVRQWLTTGLWVSSGTPDCSTNKTDHHNITEILLNVALNTIKPSFKKIYTLQTLPVYQYFESYILCICDSG